MGTSQIERKKLFIPNFAKINVTHYYKMCHFTGNKKEKGKSERSWPHTFKSVMGLWQNVDGLKLYKSLILENCQ